MEKKFSRCSNFTSEEETILVALVDKYKGIVESKKTGSITWADKEKAWSRIEQEFNSVGGRNSFRTVKNLKEKYYNLKKKTKKKFSTNKLNLMKTGGGPYTPIVISDVDSAIKNIIGSQIDGLPNKYDSDSIMPINKLVNPMGDGELSNDRDMNATILDEIPCTSVDASLHSRNTEDIIFEVIEDDVDENLSNNQQEPSEIHDWSTYSGATLQKPVSSKLKCARSKKIVSDKSNIIKKYESINHQLIQDKIDFIKFQKEHFAEEHSLKVELLKKKIELIDYQLLKK